MQVILSQDVQKVGKKNEVKEVADGYARNFLIPRKAAVVAGDAGAKRIEHEMRIIRRREEKLRKEFAEVKGRIDGIKVEFIAKAGEEGKLFGSITSHHIADKLKDFGHDVDRRKIQLPEPLKRIGEHVVFVKLAKDIVATVKVSIAAEAVAEVVVVEEFKPETDDDDDDR